MAKINEDKLKAIEMAMGQIEKQFGKGAVMKLGDAWRYKCRSYFYRMLRFR